MIILQKRKNLKKDPNLMLRSKKWPSDQLNFINYKL